MKKDEKCIFSLVGEINLSNHPSENQVVEALTEITSTAAMKEIGLEKKILGNDAGASLFGFLNEQRKDLSTLAARVAVVEKDNQELKEENHRLEGAKAIAQAVRSRVLENFKKHHINLHWEDPVIRIGDAAAHRGAARQDWYLYKDAIRHDLALYRRVHGVPWEEACRYFGE